MAAILDLANTVIRDHLADKHLGDFSCRGTHRLSESEKPPHLFLQTGPQARYRIIFYDRHIFAILSRVMSLHHTDTSEVPKERLFYAAQ